MAENLWNETEAAGLSGLDELVYRSHLLGRDRTVTNWGGGNTSMKTRETDFRGRETDVMWIKGSGSDLAAMPKQAFAGLRLERVLPLLERGEMSDDEMIAYLAHCLLDPTMPRQSIETLMHAFLPFPHIDHTHPDHIIALANSKQGEAIARDIFGDELIWQPYLRPGFTLAHDVARQQRERPKARFVILAKHGLIAWGDTSRQCYEATLEAINRAGEAIASRSRGRLVFGGVKLPELPLQQRQAWLSHVLPPVRGAVSQNQRMLLHVDQSPEVLQFVGSTDSMQLALAGAACPDYLVHTKYLPLWVDFDLTRQSEADLLEALRSGVGEYAEGYKHYFEEFDSSDFPMDDPYPRVILIPGLGIITTGMDARRADLSAQIYYRGIQVMRGASAIDRFVSLTPAEAFDVEYWSLQRYKLTLLPPENELSRHVALVMGAASGIGRAIARRFALAGAHVVITDADTEMAEQLAQELCETYGYRRGVAVDCDATREESVAEAFREAALAYGGVDIVVAEAGLASASPIEATPLAEWEKIFGVATGNFLVGREAFRTWRAQGLGGNLIFISSKNVLVQASVSSVADAAVLHLARIFAEEGGAAGIRVNTICPGAGIPGSGIRDSAWREAHAKERAIRPDEVKEYYRQRNTLKVNLFPEDVADAALFLASARSAKMTGSVLPVDGGIPAALVP